jgi:mannose-6-phosphate isomerase class I
MTTQPFYIVSLLIKQPTWGGKYIAKFKKITDPKVSLTNIGQSYELAKDSVLIAEPTTNLPFLLASANDTDHPQWHGPKVEGLNIQELIESNPEGVLGKKIVKKSGSQMPLLNKFTQAKENSYQVHVALGREFDHWQHKPESWYYFENGKATIGLKEGINLKQYQQRCQDVYQKSLQLSQQVRKQELKVESARQQLADFINQDHPSNYVNTVYPPQNSMVDLSNGGIHHSWESDSDLPRGNILYEVQLDQRDDVSSIRGFDQGKIKDNGDIRNVAINDYFTALNIDGEYNQPEQYLKTPLKKEEGGATISHIFDNPSYQLTQIEFAGQYRGTETQLDQKFHHLFVKEGGVVITWGDQEWPLAQGQSLFVPANCDNYQLTASQETIILKTTG